MHGCRAVRMAFWDYTRGAALTAPCDEDVETICTQSKRTKGVYGIGYVGRCLSKQLASRQPLNARCRKLVTAAAPKDVRTYLQVCQSVPLRLLQCPSDSCNSTDPFSIRCGNHLNERLSVSVCRVC
jgi:hypothetical protein